MIKISNKNGKNYKQNFILFTEELWEKEKKNLPKLIHPFFSGKKNEIFAIPVDKCVIYLIGVGKERTNTIVV